MNVIFCRPEFTMTELDAAIEFYDECSKLLGIYLVNPEEWKTVIYAHNEKGKIFNMLF